MQTEKWTTTAGTKIELTWDIKVYDLAVAQEITALVGDKKYVSDGQILNGNLVINQSKQNYAQLPVAQKILDEINAAYIQAKSSITNNIADHNDYLRRMHQLGY